MIIFGNKNKVDFCWEVKKHKFISIFSLKMILSLFYLEILTELPLREAQSVTWNTTECWNAVRMDEKVLQGILCPKAVTAKTMVLNLKKIQNNDWLFTAARWPAFLMRLFSKALLDFQRLPNRGLKSPNYTRTRVRYRSMELNFIGDNKTPFQGSTVRRVVQMYDLQWRKVK